MSDLYLIAHCVRGEAAFDVATKMACPHCRTYEYVEHMAVAESNNGCFDCEEAGFWWIIPTSGHRAFPWWNIPLNELNSGLDDGCAIEKCPEMPPGWPDHFKSLPAPKVDITSLFRTAQPKPHIERRL